MMTTSRESTTEGSEQQVQLAQRLRAAREYLGLSQEFVSQHTGISRTSISAIENGKRRVEALELNALAALYKRPMTYFLSGALEEPRTVHAIAREAMDLTERDRKEVLHFAQFLKAFGAAPPRHGAAAGSETEEAK